MRLKQTLQALCGVFLLLGGECYAKTAGITAIILNEGPWLKEWIHYHRNLGFSKFILFDNGSTDNTAEVLAGFIEEHLVELVSWPDKATTGNWVLTTQTPALNEGLKRLRTQGYDWVAAIDVDEYIVPEQGDSILDVLDDFEMRFPKAAVLGISWRLYGDSDIWMLQHDELMIEKLRRRSALEWRWNTIGKGIIKIGQMQEYADPHVFRVRGAPQICLDGSPYAYPNQGSANGLVINHYYPRTEHFSQVEKESQSQKILHRPFNWRLYKDFNKEEDTDRWIDRFIPGVKAALEVDLARPGSAPMVAR